VGAEMRGKVEGIGELQTAGGSTGHGGQKKEKPGSGADIYDT